MRSLSLKVPGSGGCVSIFVISIRLVQRITTFSLPRINQLVDSTSEFELLSMMDDYQGYHQIQMFPGDIPKVNFFTACGTLGYIRMLFGLINVGATYKRMVDNVFRNQFGTEYGGLCG